MKLKNSYILLIAMAIFLLVSIGSVCASENVTADSDDLIAGADSDVVLEAGEDTGDTTQNIINTTTTATGEDKYSYDSDKNITVSVKDNESNDISINESNLTVYEGSQKINFAYNSSKITILDQLSVGKHNLTINYLGNANYNASSTDFLLKIFGNYTIEANDTVYSNGETVEIPVKLFDGVDYVSLEGKLNVTLNYTNSTGNKTSKEVTYLITENGIKIIPDVKLIAASVTLNCTNATEPKTIRILLNTTISADPTQEKFNATENKTITVAVRDSQENPLNITKADLNVLKNGTIVNFEFNQTTGIITIKDIAEGSNNLTIVYKGNETYAQANTTVILNVYGQNQIIVPEFVVSENGKTVKIPITIFNGLENITIEKNNMTLNLTYTNTTTGKVSSKIIEDYIIEENRLINIEDIGCELNKASLTITYVDSTGAKTVKINLLTSVEAVPAKTKYRYNETNNITVKVRDYADHVLNITDKDLKVYDNGNEIKFKLVNSTLTVNLTEGVHNLTITYSGNETFNSSSKTLELHVYGDARINPSESVILDENNNATIVIDLNDGADNLEIDPSKLNLTFFYTVGNQTFNNTITDFTVNDQNITFTVTDDFDSAYVNIKYDTNLTGKTTIKVNTTITAPDTMQIGESQVKNLTIEVKGTNGHVINLTDKNIQILKNGTALNITVNGSTITINNALTFGVYNLTIRFIGTETYLESNKNLTLTVCGINATSTISVNSTKKGNITIQIINGNETVDVPLADLNITATYVVGNDTKVIQITPVSFDNGNFVFTIDDGNFTTATLTINYKNGTAIKNVTMNRVYNVNITPIITTVEYQDGNFTFSVVDIDDGNKPLAGKTVSISMNQNGTIVYFIIKTDSGSYSISTVTTVTTDDNGIASLINRNFYPALILTEADAPVGNYTINVDGSGVVKGSVKTNISIIKANIKITVDPYKEYYGSDKKVKITVTNAKSGNPVRNTILHLYMPETSGKDYYFQTDSNGTSEIAVKGLVGGDYQITVSNNDTENINPASTKTSITIVPVPVTINAKDVTVYYNSGVTQTIKITDKATGKALEGVYVLVLIDGNTKNPYLFLTNSKGEISFSASLAVGKHKVTIATADKRYSGTTVTKTVKVKKAKGKFTAKKVTDYYKGTKAFTVKLKNTKNKKAIYDAKVNIKIYVSKTKYYNYNGKTGMNGKLKLLLGSLKPGKYKVVVSCADTKNYDAKDVTSKIVIKKAKAKITAKKLTAKKGAKQYFKVTVKNKKTKKPIAKVKVKVKVSTGKKAKTYKIKTNTKGVAKLSTAKLKVGKHKVAITSANKYVKAKKAKSKITIKK